VGGGQAGERAVVAETLDLDKADDEAEAVRTGEASRPAGGQGLR
jgi:hypothetical protein